MRIWKRVKKVEDDLKTHQVEHVADKAADDVARAVFQRYSENVQRRLTLLEAQLEVARAKKREEDDAH